MSDTWGHLKDGTPFAAIFPDGRVPLRSIVAIIPREAGAPRCYLVDTAVLSDEQVAALAALLWEQWRPECESVEQAVAYIRDEGLPLKVEWFSTVGTTRRDFVMPDGVGGDNWDGDDRDDEDDLDYWLGQCGWVRGQGCTLAGTEECDFECPFRDDNYKGLRLTQARLAKQKKEASHDT